MSTTISTRNTMNKTTHRLRTAEGGSSITVLEGKGGGDEYDPGFSEMQVRMCSHW